MAEVAVFGKIVVPSPVQVVPISSLYAIVLDVPLPTATMRLPLNARPVILVPIWGVVTTVHVVPKSTVLYAITPEPLDPPINQLDPVQITA